MSSNPQWKSFQPPTMNSDSSILDYTKSLTIQNNTTPSSNYRSSSNGSGYNSSSNNYNPGSNIKNLSNNMFSSNTSSSNYSSNYNAYQSNNSRFPQIGTFSTDSTDSYNGDNSSTNNSYNSPSNNSNSYSDSSNNQGTRETGIIEKLLVILVYSLFLFCSFYTFDSNLIDCFQMKCLRKVHFNSSVFTSSTICELFSHRQSSLEKF